MTLRRLLTLLVLTALAVASVAFQPQVATAAPTAGNAEGQFLQLLNKQRVASGLSMLVLDGSLSAVARDWSGRMSGSNLHHNPSLVGDVDGRVTASWTRIGENVGVGDDIVALHRAFWDSIGHRNNMLGDYNRVGVGSVVSGDGTIWVTFNFMRGPALAGSTGVRSCGNPGYLLDAFGGVHPVGGAPGLSATAYWPGRDIARDLALVPGRRRGQVLDGFGGLHPVGGARRLGVSTYWRGWDIARAVAVRPGGKGAYVLDGFGGVHPAGHARPVRTSRYWRGWDIARDIQLDPRSRGARGYVLDGFGGLHPFGGMPAARASWYHAGGTASSFTFLGDGTGGYVVDGAGNHHPFAVGGAAMPAALHSSIAPSAPVLGGLRHGNEVAFVTAAGAEVGLNEACAEVARWGGWNIVRAVIGA